MFTWPVSIWISNAVSRTEHVKRYEGRRFQTQQGGRGLWDVLFGECGSYFFLYLLETFSLSLQNLIFNCPYIPSYKTLSTMLWWKPLMFSNMYNICLRWRVSVNSVGDLRRRLMPAGLIIQWLTFLLDGSCRVILSPPDNTTQQTKLNFQFAAEVPVKSDFLIFTLALWGW